MGDNNSSVRIDWFDGTVVQDLRDVRTDTTNNFDEEPSTTTKPHNEVQQTEKKAIGFKRLLDLSLLKTPLLNLELSNRPGFWLLFEQDLKDDYTVLLVQILAAVYNSLDPYDTSKIKTLLQTKFEKSDFLLKLAEYIKRIPTVKTVDKCKNKLLWNDIESFYFSILSLCNSMSKIENRSSNSLKVLYNLLEVAETSAIAVQEEHMEPIGTKFYEELHQLTLQMEQSIAFPYETSMITTEEHVPLDDYNDMNSFRCLNIFPSTDDILSRKNVQINPNIINGAYPSVYSYLDLQFKLLREDLIGPLREAISNYLENPTKKRHDKIRLHPQVRIIKTYASKNKVGYLIDLAWQERINMESVDLTKYAHNKWFKCGSLLLFTQDNFQNILFATVLDSSMELLCQGFITVSFEDFVPLDIFFTQLLMVEYEVFFEPYHSVLKVLKTLPSVSLPMERYILYVQKETKLPAYLEPHTLYMTLNENKKEILFPVTSDQWPSEKEFGLDKSQMEVFKFALTKEFAVIQGPPGTGKTFMGIKVASTLLRNFSLQGTPMLIVCYTNHALDQFLEGITQVTPDIVRLGGQSKNLMVTMYNINHKRKEVKSQHSNLYGQIRAEQKYVFYKLTKVQADLQRFETELLKYRTIKDHLKLNGQQVHLRHSRLLNYEDPVLSWLFGHLQGVLVPTYEMDDQEDLTELESPKILEFGFSEKIALRKMNSISNDVRIAENFTHALAAGADLIKIYETELQIIKERLECFKIYITYKENKNPFESTKTDPYELTTDERWQLYFNTVDIIKEDYKKRFYSLEEEYNELNYKLQDISTLLDLDVLQNTRVVGVTTTMAARRRDLILKLQSPIVIIEEAAEVLEAHIVTSITHACEHLILIGDHKQLKPSSAFYILAKHYNMDISLFERMVRNGVHACTLTTQRRMRSNFVDLLVPTIYEKLDSHASVLEYPPVKGMRDTLFFLNHSVFEDGERSLDSWTYQNIFEASWSVSLANYLRKHDYKENEITILSTYNGQVNLMQQMAKKYDLLNNVLITSVDNYQGEENRIVILSLVRSNLEGSIGFLSASNRICVALSRAREGFYIFGNMKCLNAGSTVWRSIHQKLIAQNAIGTELAIKLDDTEYKNITNPDDLDAIQIDKKSESVWLS